MGGYWSTPKNSLVKLENLNDSIYIFHDPARRKKIFIFFHDILWPGVENAHVQTWMSSGNPSVCWPKAWLSTRYREAQILSVCYNATLLKEKNTGHIDIVLLAETLWQDILSVCDRNNCPIFLIGHGLGGIVIKAIIIAMQSKRDNLVNRRTACNDLRDNNEIQRLDCFLENVKGCFYYSTPFHGVRLVNDINFPSKSPISNLLEVLSRDTCRLNEKFRKWRSYRSCKATAIYPILPTKMTFWYGQRWTVVVEEGAARDDADVFYSATKSDHFTVCKPQNETDSSYKRLIEFLPAITDEPHAHIEDTKPRSEANEYVEEILSCLPNLEGDGLKLEGCRFEQLREREFEDILSKLTNGLTKAGFKKTGDGGDFEQWELQSSSQEVINTTARIYEL